MINQNEEWRKVVERVRIDEKGTWKAAGNAIAQYFPNLTQAQLARKARQAMEVSLRAKMSQNEDTAEEVSSSQKVTYKENGDMVFEGIISLLSGELITPELVMRAHNLKSEEWTVVSFTSNAWQSQVKGGDKIVLWQSKITVRPRTCKEITFEDVDRYFENKVFTCPIVESSNKCEAGEEILEICLPDLHSGLLSWVCETGENYDLKIVKERFFTALNDIIERCKTHSFSKIIFVTLGDLLHTDNDTQTTTKGTFQQVDGRLAKIFACTLDIVIDAICLLSKIAPVEVIYISGNHDRVLGYTLIKAAQKYFTGKDNINFDVSPNPQKFRLLGNSLVGWTHGDMPKKNMLGWLQDRARREFGMCKYAEIHSGHIHSECVISTSGVTVRYMPNLASSSYWEHQQGFPNTSKTIVCYRWDMNKGLRSIWYNNI